LDVGVCLPYMERDLDRERILGWCRAIDQGPFASLSVGERITDYTIEMRTTLGAAAAVTERVRIVPSLYVLPMHSAVWAAKEIATLDVISGGRVTVTVGVGGRPSDYHAVGASMARRHERMDEQVACMRRIWAGEPPDGGVDEVGPRPVQPGGPPIHAGVLGPLATRRAAAWADGVYMWSGNGSAAEISGQLARVDAAWADARRETAPRRVAGFWFSLANDGQQRLSSYVYGYLKVLSEDVARAMAKAMDRSTPDRVLESLDAMEELGCDEVFLVPATSEPVEVERAAEIVARRG
jgi:alkanesulfonate monooxygenase SsuD/methylene tetrahydromethanopterin reductase-like flavin-dependent oxidoreductase (luciferase family)